MKMLSKILLNCSLFAFVPVLANAAGTYFNGTTYQSPQTARYSQQSYSQRARTTTGYTQGGAYNRGSASTSGVYANSNARYSIARYGQSARQTTQTAQQSAATGSSKNGFSMGAGLSRQTSMWQFEMKESQSILHYDNIDWNVFDVNAGYVFNAGNTAMQIVGGFKYGMQAGESTMIDDDITNGGYFVTEWGEDNTGDGVVDKVLGNQIGNALSIGTSKDGSMMEFNAAFGLKDFFKWGNLKVTPSIGWRYLKYELETHNNHGLSVDVYEGAGGCITVPGSDEVQCDPVLIFYDNAGNQFLATRGDTNGDGSIDLNDEIQVPSGYEFVNTGGTYYYGQPGISHKYEVTWSGPYLALDMLYDINQNNAVNAFVELGLPSYTATGDQPYRFDWQHPKSVEDTAGVGGAFHLGMGANWSTAITDTVALSIGLTYDYYTVSDADAETYLSEEYYMGIYNDRLNNLYGGDEDKMLQEDTIAKNIVALEQECPGWVCKAGGEIESFYKSMGIRVGINAKF